MDNDENTNAQVQDTQPDTGTQDQSTQNPNEGFQTRIDELTHARREAERQNAELTATVARLAGQIAEQSHYAQQPQQPVPELDPEYKRAFDAYLQPMMQQMRQQLDQVTMAAQTGRLHQSASGEDPRVVQRAQELLPAVLKAGWTPEDAVNFARGELMKQGVLQPTQRNAQGQFVPQGNVMTQTGAPPPLDARAQGGNPLPANFDRLPPDKQIEILEKRGVHRAPLFGEDN